MNILKNKFNFNLCNTLKKSFNNVHSRNYHKRMELTWSELHKQQKVLDDIYKMTNVSDFWEAALIMQSDLFHEQLFETLRSELKNERDILMRMKDIALRLGLPKDSLKANYVDRFNDHLKTFFKTLQDDIKARAADNPSLLKTNPEWEEKIKETEGFEDYIEEFDVDISEESFFKYPELNKLILEMKPDDILKNFPEMYLNGIMDEDKMRLEPHTSSMKEYLTQFEKDVDATQTINNEMWVDKLKRDTFLYIKTVLDPDFQKQSLSYSKTVDNMRVDVGLVISRDPIFFTTTQEDMEFSKYRRQVFKKYYYNSDKYLEEIETFNNISSGYWDKCNSLLKMNNDNKPNVRKWNSEKNAYDFYCLNSKHWTFVDPNVKDPKSIQYSREYEFPTLSLYNGDNFDNTRYRLYFHLCQEEFKIHFISPYPAFHITRDFLDYEKEDPKNKGFAGVRTFYMNAHHYRNPVIITPNKKHPYEDYIFTPKHEFNKYVKKNYWDAFISNLQEK